MTIHLLYQRVQKVVHRTENLGAFAILFLIALLPSLEIGLRIFFKSGLHSSNEYLLHLVLWITFVGSVITSREKRHLRLTIGIDQFKGARKEWIRTITALISTIVTACLTWWSYTFIMLGFDASDRIGFIPIRVVLAVMPLGFAFITYRFIDHAGNQIRQKIIAALGIPLAILFGFLLIPEIMQVALWPLSIILVVAGLFGSPIFVVLGGLTLLLFVKAEGALAIIPNEAYTMLTGPLIPTIPLFTLAGFILSESKAGARLVRFFQACFGWLPGGMAVMAILISSFFTTFTGASGVTILALGGLLSFVLINGGYNRKFSLGLLTSSGSLGLLFPPSLPIILYGVIAQTNIKHMFIGGMFPGIIMVMSLAIMGVIYASKEKVPRIPFNMQELVASFRESFWEILLPFIILFSYLMGFATLVETGAISVLYILIIEVLVHRDIKIRALPDAFLKCIPIIGGVLIILAIAKGLAYYIVDAEIPMILTEWVQANIESKYTFLILLNIALLITGSFMDIFSAIIVVVPLILPLGAAFDIHPVHLGIIFLANMELGYLTPPVGLNLFLASYRFNEPLGKIYRYVIPYLLILLLTVILITYVPFITTGLLNLIKL